MADTFLCHAAELVKDYPTDKCLHCPCCKVNEELITACKHICPNLQGSEVFVPPYTKCPLCKFFSQAICRCELCLTVPHAKSFTLLFNPTRSNPYPKYPQSIEDFDSDHARACRSSYLKAQEKAAHTANIAAFGAAKESSVIQHLQNLLLQPDGIIVLAEIARQNSQFLDAVDASAVVKSKVLEELNKPQDLQSTFNLRPNAFMRMGKHLQLLLEANKRQGVNTDELMHTIGSCNAVRWLSRDQMVAVTSIAEKKGGQGAWPLPPVDNTLIPGPPGLPSSEAMDISTTPIVGATISDELRRERAGMIALLNKFEDMLGEEYEFILDSLDKSSVNYRIKLEECQRKLDNAKITIEFLYGKLTAKHPDMIERVLDLLVGFKEMFRSMDSDLGIGQDERPSFLLRCVKKINSMLTIFAQSFSGAMAVHKLELEPRTQVTHGPHLIL
jgi:hypothetical protein